MSRKWPILVLLSAGAAAAVAAACSETGPDAGPRVNGCISEGCNDSGSRRGRRHDGPGRQRRSGRRSDRHRSSRRNLAPHRHAHQGRPPVRRGTRLDRQPPHLLGHEREPEPPLRARRGRRRRRVSLWRRQAQRQRRRSAGSPRHVRGRAEPPARHAHPQRAGPRDATAIATTYNGTAFNEPNDVIVRARRQHLLHRSALLTDPDGGTGQARGLPPAPGRRRGGASDLAFDFNKPNGIALSQDGSTLYVVDNGDGRSSPRRSTATVRSTAASEARRRARRGRDGRRQSRQPLRRRNGGHPGLRQDGRRGSGPSPSRRHALELHVRRHRSEDALHHVELGCVNAATGLYSIRLNVPGLP